jgi:hypothetical protein
VDVWVRLRDQRIAVYRCFEVLPDGKYCVQSQDFFSIPLDFDLIRRAEAQFFELLAEEAPERKSRLCDTLEEAIKKWDEEFRLDLENA